MDDHPSVVLEALRVLKPHGLVKNIRMVGDRVELVMETGQVLTYLPESQPVRLNPDSESTSHAGDLSNLKMFELRKIASEAGVVFTNKTTKAALIDSTVSAQSISSPPPSVLDGGGRLVPPIAEGAV